MCSSSLLNTVRWDKAEHQSFLNVGSVPPEVDIFFALGSSVSSSAPQNPTLWHSAPRNRVELNPGFRLLDCLAQLHCWPNYFSTSISVLSSGWISGKTMTFASFFICFWEWTHKLHIDIKFLLCEVLKTKTLSHSEEV